MVLMPAKGGLELISREDVKDVCAEYGITSNTEPTIAELPLFPEIQTEAMDTELRGEMLDQLLKEVDAKI